MKPIIIMLLVFATTIFAGNCADWQNNSDNCLYDTTASKPKYNNTEQYMRIGELACRTYSDKYYTYKKDIELDNGLLIDIKLPRRICRRIVDISRIVIPHTYRIPKKVVDRACCDRAHADDLRLYGSYAFRNQCYHGETTYHCANTVSTDTTYYTEAYQIQYSDSAVVDFEYTIKDTRIELSSDYYIDSDNIEIYRTDGTLKYRGELTYIPADLENLPTYKTRGWCYNRSGTKELRRTNNIHVCP